MKLDINVAVYEDNDSLRKSLTRLIKGSGLLRFVGAYPDCRNILENCATEMPDMILMDIDMPYLSGIEATAMVKEAYPQIEVMMLTVFEERNKIFDALHAGATGYLLKKSSAIQIIEGITELVNGGSPTSGEIARKVLDFFTATGNHEETFHSLRSGVGGTPAIDSGRQLQDDRRTAPLHRYGSVSINTSTVN